MSLKYCAAAFMIFAFPSTVFSQSPAGFKYQNHFDEFDQTKTKSVVGLDDFGSRIQMLDISSDAGLEGNYSLILIPSTNVVCGTKSDAILSVRFLTIKEDGTRTDTKELPFALGKRMNFLIMGRSRENAEALAHVFVQMAISKEAMFRYVDECGSVTTMTFDLQDFKKAVKEADFDAQ